MTKPLRLISLLLVSTTILLSPLVNAEPLAGALAECRQQQNALKRLVCYDEISVATAARNPIKPAPSHPLPSTAQADSQAHAQPVTSVQSAPVVKAAISDDFGLEHKKKVTEEQADQLYLTVSGISYSPRKELIVEFDNGQVWRQNGSGFYAINVGERHFVKRGMFNSFTLGNPDNNRTIKVRRVQ